MPGITHGILLLVKLFESIVTQISDSKYKNIQFDNDVRFSLTGHMKKNMILLLALIVLYFGVGFTCKALYGDSYPFLQGDHYWEPDGNGGWIPHGKPTTELPTTVSEVPPLITYYLPFFVPGFVLFLFLFTPLGRLLEEKKEEETEDTAG